MLDQAVFIVDDWMYVTSADYLWQKLPSIGKIDENKYCM
jgi:hypothetical protein